jgi:hypothetical protein
MAEPGFSDDTWGATTRAAVESIAWVGGPWAAGELLGLWAVPLAALVVIGVPWWVKRALPLPPQTARVPPQVAGLIRVMLFIDLCVIAVVAMWYLFGPGAGLLTAGLGVAAHAAGWRRIRWLMSGAPQA